MNPRILLVEDDPTTRAFLAAATEALPARVDAVGSLAAARLRATTCDYALWLVDAHLPDGHGTALLAELRAAGLRTPAVAHTAAREPALRDALCEAGFVAVVGKPVAAADLQATLREVLTPHARERRQPRIEDPVPAAADAPVWDDARALSALNGRREHVETLRTLFLAELPGARGAVESAVQAGDRASLRATLHRLQASCGFVGATRLSAAVQALQGAADPAPLLADFVDAAEATLAP